MEAGNHHKKGLLRDCDFHPHSCHGNGHLVMDQAWSSYVCECGWWILLKRYPKKHENSNFIISCDDQTVDFVYLVFKSHHFLGHRGHSNWASHGAAVALGSSPLPWLRPRSGPRWTWRRWDANAATEAQAPTATAGPKSGTIFVRELLRNYQWMSGDFLWAKVTDS